MIVEVVEKIIEKIKNEISQNNIQLLGQVDITDKEYETLKFYTKEKLQNKYIPTIKEPNLLISMLLVQIAIKYYKEGNYWSNFEEELEGISQNKKDYICNIFMKTLKHYNLFQVPQKDLTTPYVENIKAHAFIPNYYIPKFYDFLYDFFENNLLREIPETLKDDLSELSNFVSKSLDNNKNELEDTGSKKTKKTYILLKPTRQVLALTNINTLYTLFINPLKIIESYYYDNKVPLGNNRFENEFKTWYEAKNEQEKNKNRNHARRTNSLSPYIKINPSNGAYKLIIPPQKFRNYENIEYAYATVNINGQKTKINLDIYKSLGLLITEEKSLPIENIFAQFEVTIHPSERKYTIEKSNYRILNSSNESISKLYKGSNYILTENFVKINFSNQEDLKDSYNTYDYNFYKVNVTEESIITIGSKVLKLNNKDTVDTLFESTITHFEVFFEEQKLLLTRKHPILFFNIEKNKLPGSILIINNHKYKIENLCIEKEDKLETSYIKCSLENLNLTKDGFYKIELDIPSSNIKQVTEYLLLKKFDCRFNKGFYIDTTHAILKIEKDENVIYPFNDKIKCKYETNELISYEIPIYEEKIELILDVDKYYNLKINIPLLLHGFTQSTLKYIRDDYIWYTDVQNSLYIKAPNIKTLSAYLDDDEENLAVSKPCGDDIYYIDITEFNKDIEKNNTQKKYRQINLLCTDEQSRELKKIKLLNILSILDINPYFSNLIFNDNNTYLYLDIKGKAKLYVTIIEKNCHTKTQKEIIKNQELFNGLNILSNLEKSQIYNIYPYMIEEDEFGINKKTTYLKTIYKIKNTSITDLINYTIKISIVKFNHQELPLSKENFIELKRRKDDMYMGYLKENKKVVGAVLVKIQLENQYLKMKIKVSSKETKRWIPLYFDNLNNKIINCDETREKNNLENYICLENSNTNYYAHINEIRSEENDI